MQPSPQPQTHANGWATTAAKTITLVLQPNVLQIAGLWAVAWQGGWPYRLVTLLLGLVVPLSAYVVYLRQLPKTDPQNTGFDLARKHRVVPFIINLGALMLLLLALYNPAWDMLSNTYDLLFALTWVLFLMWVNILCFAVTLAYKVSLHVTAAAALFAGLYKLHGLDDAGWLAIGALCVLLVIWARHTLRAHTWHQLLAGLVLGLTSAWVFMWLRPLWNWL